ncbi:M20/M25/M40 family metallo-hydrolase [Halovulum sp. GXIMD14794]
MKALLAACSLTFVAGVAAAQDAFDTMDPSYGTPLGKSETVGLDLVQPSDDQRQAYDAWFTENEERHLSQHAELVAFRSLAMVPEERGEVDAAGAWLVERLKAIGATNTNYDADALVASGEIIADDSQPTVLVYGHFDVQPVDEARWDTDPWVATEKDGRIYGRGATDDKGMIIAFLSTLEGIIATDGTLPVNVKFLLDGAEEFGSQGMPDWLAARSDWLADADFGVNIDAMMASDDQGLMWRGLRGGSDVEVTVTSANTALHSGIYGGAAPNAAIAAAKIIASMWNDDGTVAIEGFKDDVTPATDSMRAEIAAAVAGVDEAAARARLEIAEWIGDEDYSIIERTWIQPSLDVTGIRSGYTEGKASIIPFDAWFRVMARTGFGQDPEKVNAAIIAHIEKNIPWGVSVEMTSTSFGGAPFFDETDFSFRIAQQILTNYFGQEPQVLYVGGGVPALAYVPEAGGPQLVSFGFQRSDEGFHADNEFMRLSSFRTAQRAYAELLHAFRDQPKRDD